MNKFYSALSIFIFLLGCSKDDSFSENTKEEEEIVNLAPQNFDVAVIKTTHRSATINWNEAVDPESDIVTYSIYLNNKLIIDNTSKLSHQFINLEESTLYSGKIIAKDANSNHTEISFSFQTEKYYLKYLMRYDYGPYDHGPNGLAHGSPHSMIKSNDQNYVVAGVSVFPNGNGYRLFVLKHDYEGNEIWRKFYNYDVTDGASPKIINSSTGFVLVSHHHVLKLDNEGNTIWYKKIDSYDIPDAAADVKSVAQDSEGNIFIVGGRGSSEAEIVQEAVLTKLNGTGTILWETSFKTSIRSFFNDIIITPSNELIILGTTDTSGSTYEEYLQRPSVEQTDFWVLKVTTEGKVLWENTYGDGRFNFARKIILKSNGNFVFTGFSWGALDISEGRIFEIDPSGKALWDISSDLSSIFSIAETRDGGFITTGYVDVGPYGSVLGLYKFSSIGIEEWFKIHQENLTYLYGRSVLVEEDGGFRIAGNMTRNYYYDEEKPELLIYKTDPEGNYE